MSVNMFNRYVSIFVAVGSRICNAMFPSSQDLPGVEASSTLCFHLPRICKLQRYVSIFPGSSTCSALWGAPATSVPTHFWS